MILRLSFLLIFAAPLATVAAPTEAELAEFFLPPEINPPTLSPDGTYLAYIARDGDRYSLAVYNLVTRQKQLINDPKIWPMQVWWKTPRRLLVRTTNYRLDGIGYSAMDPDGGKLEDLFRLLDQGGYLYDALPEEPRKVLMMDGRELKKVNIDSGISTTVDGHIGRVGGWVTDAQGRARAALRNNPDYDTLELWWRPPGGDWRHREFKHGEARFIARGVDQDEHYLWGWQHGTGRDIALARFDTLTGKFETRALGDGREPSVMLFAGPNHRGRPFAAGYNEGGLMRLFPLAESDRKAVTLLQQRFADYYTEVVDTTADNKTWLVELTNSRTPGAYVLFNTETGAATLFARAHGAKLAPERLTAAEPVSFPARGGQTLTGLLWRPKGVARPPLVIFCPGELPIQAVVDHYQADVQALLAQGFAVLQVNVRGTVGSGHVDREAVEGKWSEAMREDFEDAVEGLAQRQLIDGGRVGLYGANFGAVLAIKIAAESQRFAAIAALNAPKEVFRQDLLAFSNENGFNALTDKLGGWGDAGKLARDLTPTRNIPEIAIPALYLSDEDSWRGRPVDAGQKIWAAAKKSKIPGQTGLAYSWTDKPVFPLARAADNARIARQVGEFFAAAMPAKP